MCCWQRWHQRMRKYKILELTSFVLTLGQNKSRLESLHVFLAKALDDFRPLRFARIVLAVFLFSSSYTCHRKSIVSISIAIQMPIKEKGFAFSFALTGGVYITLILLTYVE